MFPDSRKAEEQQTTDFYIASGARVRNTSAITISNDTATDLTFDAERYDVGGYHSTSLNTDRLTVPQGGIYLVLGQVEFEANATGFRIINIVVSNTTTIATDRRNALSGATTRLTLTGITKLGTGDYMTLRVYQNSGGDLDVLANANYSPEFTVWRIG